MIMEFFTFFKVSIFSTFLTSILLINSTSASRIPVEEIELMNAETDNSYRSFFQSLNQDGNLFTFHSIL